MEVVATKPSYLVGYHNAFTGVPLPSCVRQRMGVYLILIVFVGVDGRGIKNTSSSVQKNNYGVLKIGQNARPAAPQYRTHPHYVLAIQLVDRG